MEYYIIDGQTQGFPSIQGYFELKASNSRLFQSLFQEIYTIRYNIRHRT